MTELIKVHGYDENNRPTKFELEVIRCPFCKSDELRISNHSISDSWNVLGQMSCDNCGAKGPSKYGTYTHAQKDLQQELAIVRGAAIDAWNMTDNKRRDDQS